MAAQAGSPDQAGSTPEAGEGGGYDVDAALVFRAVNAGGARRGIRLEAIFWKVVSTMAAARGRTLGQEVAGAAAGDGDRNLASSLRVEAARWLSQRISAYEQATAPEAIFALIHASPSPAFVLTADRKMVQANEAFLSFVRTRLITAETQDVMRSARLSLDAQLDQVIATLRGNPKTPVATGFAFGVAERRVRGQLRIVLAPTASVTMVIAYITQA